MKAGIRAITQPTIQELVEEYIKLKQQIDILNNKANQIKQHLKEQGIGISEPQDFHTELGKVRIRLKVQEREQFNKKRAKEILPEDLYSEIVDKKVVEIYDIRVVKK